MEYIQGPFVVMPPVYHIPGIPWRWCKLTEVCPVVHELARRVGFTFAPTPEELVNRFSALVRPNRGMESVRGLDVPSQPDPKKKIFRYSPDGVRFCGTNVSEQHFSDGRFRLEIEGPYPETLFVPEGWALDTIKAVLGGVVYAFDSGDCIVGQLHPEITRKVGSTAITLVERRPETPTRVHPSRSTRKRNSR